MRKGLLRQHFVSNSLVYSCCLSKMLERHDYAEKRPRALRAPARRRPRAQHDDEGTSRLRRRCAHIAPALRRPRAPRTAARWRRPGSARHDDDHAATQPARGDDDRHIAPPRRRPSAHIATARRRPREPGAAARRRLAHRATARRRPRAHTAEPSKFRTYVSRRYKHITLLGVRALAPSLP